MYINVINIHNNLIFSLKEWISAIWKFVENDLLVCSEIRKRRELIPGLFGK